MTIYNFLKISLLLKCLLRWLNRFSKLPVCFSIKLICSNKNVLSFFMCCINQDEICGNSFILLDLHNIANFDIFTVYRRFWTIKYDFSVLFFVDFFISSKSLKVIKKFFDHRNRKYKCKGSNIREQKSNSKSWNKLSYCDNQKEEIEEKFELMKKYNWNKSQHVVLLIFDFVVWEFLWSRDSIEEDFSVLKLR